MFQYVETPLQSCSKTRGLPGLPPLPGAVKEPSDLYKVYFLFIISCLWSWICRIIRNYHYLYENFYILRNS